MTGRPVLSTIGAFAVCIFISLFVLHREQPPLRAVGRVVGDVINETLRRHRGHVTDDVIGRTAATRSDDERHNFRLPNRAITEYDDDVARRLAALVRINATSRDPGLIRLILDVIDPPANHHMIKMARRLIKTPQGTEADVLLNRTRGGFFVECGANDGERSSNSLFFELERGWTGLLVEMDPYFYTQLLGKSRESWSINACLSPRDHVTQQAFVESTGGGGELVRQGSKPKGKKTRLIPCFPLDALLIALNRTTIDYFSLDVEGFELEILKTIPFSKLDIKVLSVEYVHGRFGKQAYVDFMAKQGYEVHKDIHHHDSGLTLFVDDFIFVKRREIRDPSLNNSATRTA